MTMMVEQSRLPITGLADSGNDAGGMQHVSRNNTESISIFRHWRSSWADAPH
jgi:hypothetical protein